MNLRKAIGPLLAIVLLAGVAMAIRYSMRDKKAAESAAGRVTVRVLTGSEKEKFLTDPDLAKVLADEGIVLDVSEGGFPRDRYPS